MIVIIIYVFVLYVSLFEQMFICAVNRAAIFNIHIL